MIPRSKFTGRRQHFVPQQMIRNFAGSDGKIVEMIKPGLQISTRRRAPSGILFEDDFYKAGMSDFDAEFLTPIEQRFAKIYPKVLQGAQINGHEGVAFVDWIASMLVRTRLVVELMSDAPDDSASVIADRLDVATKQANNIARTSIFSFYRDLFVRRDWHWKRRIFPSPCLVITDHPVCMTSMSQSGGQMVLIPMSSSMLMLGGRRASVEPMGTRLPIEFNCFFTAYARCRVFAGDKKALEEVQVALSDPSLFGPKMAEAARKPFCGGPQRMRERIRTQPTPTDADLEKAIRAHAESFGPYRWG